MRHSLRWHQMIFNLLGRNAGLLYVNLPADTADMVIRFMEMRTGLEYTFITQAHQLLITEGGVN